jgi:hypothetical protein
MKNLPCCQRRIFPKALPLKPRLTRIAGFLLSGTTLLLIPKCPACLSAWLVLATGLTISTSTAGYLRLALIIVSIGSLIFLSSAVVRVINSTLKSKR